MTTIKIISEISAEKTIYRASCGAQQAIGITPGQALDMLEKELAIQRLGDSGGTLIIVQRFRPDEFFTAKQQLRLRELMEQFHQAKTVGEAFDSAKKQELETLVDAEWNAAIERAEAILKQTQSDKQ
jgi:hypothetical protein